MMGKERFISQAQKQGLLVFHDQADISISSNANFTSDMFLYVYQFGLYPKILKSAAALIAQLIQDNNIEGDILSGVPMGGHALSVATALKLDRQILELRTHLKDHAGYMNTEASLWTVQGNAPPQKVIVIEDGTVTGKNALVYCNRLRKEGFIVNDIISFIDFGKHFEQITHSNIRIHSIFKENEIRRLIKSKNQSPDRR